MITPEDFKVLADKIVAGETLSNDDAKELLNAVYEMDTNLVILQNTLELSVLNVQEIVPGIAELVLKLSGRTDKKIKKKVATIAGKIVANFAASIQLYMAGAYEEAQKLIQEINNPTIGEENEQTNK